MSQKYRKENESNKDTFFKMKMQMFWLSVCLFVCLFFVPKVCATPTVTREIRLYGHLRGPVTPVAERFAVQLSLPVFTTSIHRGWPWLFEIHHQFNKL